MALEIFWGSGSPFSWRVLLAAEVKGLEYTSRLLDFSKGDLGTPEFLQMNPRARVPVIRDDGFVLFESLPILEYLEHKSPAVPLFGKTRAWPPAFANSSRNLRAICVSLFSISHLTCCDRPELGRPDAQ